MMKNEFVQILGYFEDGKIKYNSSLNVLNGEVAFVHINPKLEMNSAAIHVSEYYEDQNRKVTTKSVHY